MFPKIIFCALISTSACMFYLSTNTDVLDLERWTNGESESAESNAHNVDNSVADGMQPLLDELMAPAVGNVVDAESLVEHKFDLSHEAIDTEATNANEYQSVVSLDIEPVASNIVAPPTIVEDEVKAVIEDEVSVMDEAKPAVDEIAPALPVEVQSYESYGYQDQGVYQYQENIAPSYHTMQAPVEYYPAESYATAPAAHYGGNQSYASGSHPAVNVDNFNLFQYRRMMLNAQAPQPHELAGTWRGTNKGLATVAIDKQFIKEFQVIDGQVYGDNISVNERWEPVYDQYGGLERTGKFKVQQPRGIGAFRHGAVLNYRAGNNGPFAASNVVVDRVVKLDDNHMLGRAVVKFGPVQIPLAFFVLERAGH